MPTRSQGRVKTTDALGLWCPESWRREAPRVKQWEERDSPPPSDARLDTARPWNRERSLADREFDVQQFVRGIHELLVLSTLQSGEKHGYQIGLDVQTDSNGLFCFKHGTLYPILHRLEGNGADPGHLVEGWWAKEEGLLPHERWAKTPHRGDGAGPGGGFPTDAAAARTDRGAGMTTQTVGLRDVDSGDRIDFWADLLPWLDSIIG